MTLLLLSLCVAHHNWLMVCGWQLILWERRRREWPTYPPYRCGRMLTRPSFFHCKTWSTVSFPPHLSQVCLFHCGCMPKRSRRLSLNSSFEIVVPFKRSGTTISHTPATVSISSFWRPLLVSLRLSLSRCASSFSYLTPLPYLILLRTQYLCSDV